MYCIGVSENIFSDKFLVPVSLILQGTSLRGLSSTCTVLKILPIDHSLQKNVIFRRGRRHVMWCGVRHVLLYAAEGHISSDIKYYTARFLPISASRCAPPVPHTVQPAAPPPSLHTIQGGRQGQILIFFRIKNDAVLCSCSSSKSGRHNDQRWNSWTSI
jgi:hypothetical protein